MIPGSGLGGHVFRVRGAKSGSQAWADKDEGLQP